MSYKHQSYSRMVLILLIVLTSMGMNDLVAQDKLFEAYAKADITKQQNYYLQQIKNRTAFIDYRLIYVNEVLLTKAQRLNLSLFGEPVTIVKDKIITRKEGRYSWFGHCDPIFGTANFVVKGQAVTGMVRVPGYVYTIKPLGEGLHVLVMEDPSRFPEDHPQGAYEQKLEQKEQKSKSDAAPMEKMGEDEKYCKVRVIVAYTDSVAMQNFDPLSEIQLATDNMNNANQNSGVNHEVEIARVFRVSYTDSWDLDDDLDRFKSTGDGVMDEVHSLRDRYDADLCQLVVSGALDGCGLADAIGAGYSSAFCVSAYGCIAGNLTYAHEFGHLYNCRHDTYVDGSSGSNHGHVDLAGMWRTVMAYNDECDDNGFGCTRLQFWSNPSVNNAGSPTGVSGISENAAQMNTYELTVRDFQAIPEVKTISTAETIPNQELADFVALMRVETSPATSYIFESGSEGAFHAYSEVVIKTGFHARSGTNFTAFIDDDCTSGSSLVAANSDQERFETNYREDRMAQAEAGIPLWTMFPNPNHGVLNLQLTLSEQNAIYLTIYDVTGKKMMTLIDGELAEAGVSRYTYQIDDLEPGTYFVAFRSGKDRWVKPLIRMNGSAMSTN